MTQIGSLAAILALAALGGIAARALRQPLLLGYLAAGVLISALGWVGPHQEILGWMGQLGVTLLLFLVGLELPIGELKSLGRVAVIAGLGQIVLTTAGGYLLCLALGLPALTSLYLGLALAFSSTVIVVKLLTEKRDLGSLYGRVSISLLLIQDFVAIGLLVVLAGLGEGRPFMPFQIAWVMAKGLALTATALWLSDQILPKVLHWLGESGEMLFVAAITWCLGVAAVVSLPVVGFSLEIGGFLAGLALSGAAQHLQIGARIRPLRDFFLTLFFVALGASIHIQEVGSLWLPALALAAFVLVGKPVLEMLILTGLGYQKRPAFLVGLTGAQISEFSLILIAAAAALGHISQSAVTLMALVGAISIVVSALAVTRANGLYDFLRPYLGWLDGLRPKSAVGLNDETSSARLVLVGYNRTGKIVLPALRKLGEVVVVDFNPLVQTADLGSRVIVGDLADYDLYEQLNLSEATLVVSTVSDLHDNLQFLAYLKGQKRRPLVIVTAADAPDSKLLYQAGADYVIIPHRVGGELLAHLLSRHGVDKAYFHGLRKSQSA